MSEEKRFYGGQAVLEGVMMRGRDVYATAVRRRDNRIVVERRPVPHYLEGWPPARIPLIRGTFMLVETLTLGLRSLQFSGNVAIQDEVESAREAEKTEGVTPETEPRRPWLMVVIVTVIGAALVWFVSPKLAPIAARRLPWFDTPAAALLPVRIALAVVLAALVARLLRRPGQVSGPQTLSDTAMWLAMAPALAFGLFVFVLLPSWVTDVVKLEGGYSVAVLKNLIEGGFRLAAILGYIAVISLIPQVRRVFQYHGAEHQTINALEKNGSVDLESAAQDSPLHPRCGTAFLLLFIVLKIIVGCFFGWPIWYWRLALRVAMVPVVAALAYETTRLAGRHRDSWLAKLLSGPGLLLQRMTTREPDRPMVQVAMYALAAVAPEVSLPADWPPPEEFVLNVAQGDGEPKVEGETA